MPASVAPSVGQRPRHGNRTRRIAPATETYAPVAMPILRIVQAPLSTVARRLWRDRAQQACVCLVGVLGFNRQPVPHSCHVDQNGLNSRIWRAVRHLPAFNGVQSAFHRRNHCGAARRRTSRPHAQLHNDHDHSSPPDVVCSQTRKNFAERESCSGQTAGPFR
jgi:hypothetical protein